MQFDITHTIPGDLGRAGKITTPHGVIETPAFVVVGTKAAVKGVTIDQVVSTGAQVVLGNTYHLMLQPGSELVAMRGGLANFMRWQGPTMTDSGGFQVFSLGEAFGTKVSKVATGEEEMVSKRKGYAHTNKLCVIDEEGVMFRSHINGDRYRLTPERSMEIQWQLGADIIFAFDECTSPQADKLYQCQAMERTHRWALRSLERHQELDSDNQQALFGVVQGGRFEELRRESARELAIMETKSGARFDGFGIGGSFNKEDLGTAVRWVNEVLPVDKPRHLLGIGEPRDVFLGVLAGCDLFDCVSPTRLGRHGTAYTATGTIHITNAAYRHDPGPISVGCGCYTCHSGYSRDYLSHLFRAGEMIGPTLVSIHNLYFIVQLVANMRAAIISGGFMQYMHETLKSYYG